MDVLAAPKAYAQTRLPDRHNPRPVLRPSSTETVASWTSTWFLTVSLIFILSPLALLGSFVSVASMFGPDLVDECLALVKTSPLGATVIVGYFLVLLAAWVTLVLPDVIPVLRILQGLIFRFRYRRGHISHMRLDRLARLVKDQEVFTVFVAPPSGPTIPLLVSTNTTVWDIELALICRAIFPRRRSLLSYLLISGFRCQTRLKLCDTMGDLQAGPLTHFFINCPLLGGSGPGEAVGEDGKLKDAKDILWYHDKDDTVPIASGSPLGTSGRSRNTVRMDAILEAEAQSDGEKTKKRRKRQAKGKGKEVDPELEGDPAFVDLSSDSSSSTGEGDTDDLADSLPSKTIPAGQKRTSKAASKKPKRKRLRRQDDHNESTVLAAPSTASTSHTTKPKKGIRRNPIYHFYEEWDVNSDGKVGNPGDKHYRCHHGNHKIFTISKASNYNLHTMIGHIRTHFKALHDLYLVMKSHESPTTDEILMASGKRAFDDSLQAEYLKMIELQASGIKEAFAKQQVEPWDQDKFERLLIKWMVACDQPIDEVEKPEFIAVTSYGKNSKFTLPKRDGVRRRVMKLGDETVEQIKAMFAALEGKISLSLDAWTSSNCYAFLAIVAHYITNDGECEELLIDFQELIGQHSGENMASVVWSTLETYNIQDKIIAVVMDNASNNDTLMEALEVKCQSAGIEFSASAARMRCMPHTIHLAAVKLLEGIGIMSKSEAAQASSNANYQDDVNADLDREHDLDATAVEDEVNNEEISTDAVDHVKAAVQKLRKIVRSVRSTPQRRESWARQIQTVNSQNGTSLPNLLLILDVKTRWSSTHQMLRRALDYHAAVDSFSNIHRDLWSFSLSAEEWEAIDLVALWLKSFRAATTQMSATRTPMLSTTHAVFHGLQEDLCEIIRELPATVPPSLKKGLTDAHCKLSDYYYKIDESPYYLWSSLLDPRISYGALKEEFSSDASLLHQLDLSKLDLRSHFNDNYRSPQNPTGSSQLSSTPSSSLLSVTSDSTSTTSNPNNSPQKNFTARFQRRGAAVDELNEFWNLSQEDFQSCDPVKWWYGRRAQFPNLYRLARDIFSIPGSAVAVEHIFSGGRDTISLRRASLKPNTIRVLMLVKRRLLLKRQANRCK